MLTFIAAHVLTIVIFGTTLLFLIKLLREHRSPTSTLAWGLSIALIPYVGIPLYLLLGGRKTRAVTRRKGDLYERRAPDIGGERDGPSPILSASGVPPPTRGNRVRFISGGEEAYRTLLSSLRAARENIDIGTFILGHDEVGRSIVECLAQKAEEGVAVRLLLDALGCLRTRGRFVDPVRRAGGRVGIFLPVLPLHRKWSANLRNHRKMVLVDGRLALVGGMNLAREYMGPTPAPGRWTDTCAVVQGPAVADLARVWATDWEFATGLPPVRADERPRELPAAQIQGTSLQVVASGPDVRGEPLQDAVLTSILESRERVWLATPYFVPDEALLKLLTLTARLGRDVRVIVPSRSNHALADLARGAPLRILADAGSKVLFYEPGMLHSKLIVVDDRIAFLGSANMDNRSLHLNYELAVIVRSAVEVRTVADCLTGYAAHSRAWSALGDGRPGWARELAEDVARLFSPLL